MSGGYFDYNQYKIGEMADMIQEVVDTNEIDRNYSDKTIDEFRSAVNILQLAKIYVQRIDWLLEGDDAENSFHKRLEKDILELQPSLRDTIQGIYHKLKDCEDILY